jgi:hypothetical protein
VKARAEPAAADGSQAEIHTAKAVYILVKTISMSLLKDAQRAAPEPDGRQIDPRHADQNGGNTKLKE